MVGKLETARPETLSAVGDVSPQEWDRLVLDSAPEQPSGQAVQMAGNPFLLHAFLKALEDSGSAGARAGWAPRHVVLKDGNGTLVGALPCYLKSHSQGEYVFDHGWADAFSRAGGRYYPKLQCSVPFTPATGPRLLAKRGAGRKARLGALLDGLKALGSELGVSSAHITFMEKGEWDLAAAQGFLQRTDQQFHWLNRGYADFGEFLDQLSSRKRKNIRKERETALAGTGIAIEILTGRDLTETVWDQFFEFYMDTGSRKWGRPYLNRRFFSLIGQSVADRIVLVMARHNRAYVAGAINFLGDGVLYGRHWGAIEEHPCLHFEVCYYQAIEYAIANRLAKVEAGAQGEHKLARGYIPVTTYSAHWIAHAGLRRAVSDYLDQERRHVELAGEAMLEHAPFRKGAPAP